MPLKLNLGCGKVPIEGYVNVDRRPAPGVDLVVDLQRTSWPFRDSQFDEVLASHILEHLIDMEAAMREIHRVMKPGGLLKILVPYGLRSL